MQKRSKFQSVYHNFGKGILRIVSFPNPTAKRIMQKIQGLVETNFDGYET
ncbi:MAG: hypothetical protein QXD48_00350 [Candidatus Aenigmatarchaeota archaeon]